MRTTIIFLFLFMLQLTGCDPNDTITGIDKTDVYGTGVVVSRSLDLPSFKSISNVVLTKVSIKRGNTQQVVFKAQQNILDCITTEVRENILYVSVEDDKSISTSLPIEAEITIPEIISITEIGAGVYSLEGGRQERLIIEIIGAGAVDASNLAVDECYIQITGVGSCYVDVDKLLDVIITGAGTVYYWGSPQVNSVIAGVGNVVKR